MLILKGNRYYNKKQIKFSNVQFKKKHIVKSI